MNTPTKRINHPRVFGGITLAIAALPIAALAVALPVMRARYLIAMCMLGLVVAVTATIRADSVLAQDPLLPLTDLSLESSAKNPGTTSVGYTITLRNITLVGYSPVEAHNIVVKVTADHGEPFVAENFIRSITHGEFDAGTGLWIIPTLLPSSSATLVLSPRNLSPSYNTERPFRLHAEIIAPIELPDYRGNNETEVWYSANAEFLNWDTSVAAEVSDSFPDPDSSTTFKLSAFSVIFPPSQDSVGARAARIQYGVQVKVELSGLTLEDTTARTSSSGGVFTPIDDRSGIWDVGTLEPGRPRDSLLLPVVVTSEDIPLRQRCLTTRVTQNFPSWDLDPTKPGSDIATACLGTKFESEGEIDLFYLHNCRDDRISQCGSDDLALLVKKASNYFNPESLIFHLPAPLSLTGGAWKTGDHESHTDFHGMDVRYNLKSAEDFGMLTHFNASIAEVDSAPGSFEIHRDAAPTDAVINVTIPFFSLSGTTNCQTAPSCSIASFPATILHPQARLTFGALGTYKIRKTIGGQADGNPFTTTGVYTFRVGPISELRVWDGGPSPLAGTGQRAYTILAANDGPDTPPAVEVSLSGVPQGVEAVLPYGSGEFKPGTCGADGLCDAVWDLEEMLTPEARIGRGQTEFPTLTLIAPANAPASNITATIANVDDYSVCIGREGTLSRIVMDANNQETCEGPTGSPTGHAWHTTDYFDYDKENDTKIAIAAHDGTGEGDPGTPVVRAQLYPQPPTALVRWDPVERLNFRPVSHYEVWRSVAACHAPGPGDSGTKAVVPFFIDDLANADDPVCYYVRAVNGQGVPGFWSEPVLASGVTRVTPHVSVRGEPAVGEGSTIYFTINAFPAPNPGETLTVNYTVSQQGDVLASGQAGRKQVTVDDQGEVRIFVQSMDDEVDEADGAVTVTLNSGSGYELSSARSASVPVLDDERSEVFFTRPSAATVGENAGRRNIEITIDPAPALPLPITYSVSGTARAGADYRIAGLSGSAGSVTARPGATRVNIPVQIVNDGGGELDETIVLTLSTSDEYDLFSPLTYTLTIEDDDGSGVSFAQEASSVGEADGTHTITVNLAPAATENVTINYTVGGSARSPADYTINGSGSVMAVAGATSVTIPVSIVNDNENEGDEDVVLTLGSGAGYTLGANRRHTLTILDNDRPRASFNAAASSYAEDNAGPHNVTVSLNPPAPSGGLTLRYRVSGSATRGRDYAISNYGTVTVQANATSVDIPVTITDDGINEAAETVVLTLQAGSSYTLGEREHTLTIEDNDQSQVFFAAGDARVVESNGTHRAVITLDPRPHGDIPISYSVSGDAGSPADYTIAGLTGSTGTVTARGGASSVAIPIAINDDRAAESSETVVLTLDAGDGYTVLNSGNRYTLTIEDNDASEVSFQAFEGSVDEADGSHVVTVELGRTLTSAVTINYTTRGRATHGEDYTITGYGSVEVPAGSRSADITINITDDTVYDGEEMVVLALTEGLYNVGTRDRYLLTILDDEEPPDDARVVSFSNFAAHNSGAPRGCERNEGQGGCRPAFFTYGGDLPSPLEVVIKYVGGTATLGEDFEFTGGPAGVGETFTVTVPANAAAGEGGGIRADATLAWIEGLWPIADGRSDDRETIIFRLVNGPGYRVGGVTEFTMTIRD